MFREGESRGREKEHMAASFSAVAVNGGLQGGRRESGRGRALAEQGETDEFDDDGDGGG